MNVKHQLKQMNPEEGLTFLELLAHNLTIQVRIAASRREPYGENTEEQTRSSMYWINESLHDVVQLTRDLRLRRREWDPNDIFSCLQIWLNYKNASEYVKSALDVSFDELSNR